MPTFRRVMGSRKAFTAPARISFSGVNGQIDHGGGLDGDGALRVAAAYIANTLIADEVGSLPMRLVQRDDTTRQPVKPPELRALWGRPNGDQDTMGWMVTNSLSLTLHGVSYNALDVTAGGELKAMWPLNPADCSLERLGDGGLRLRVAGKGGLENHPGQQAEFMMIPLYVLPGRLEPISPVAYAAEILGLGAAYQRMSRNMTEGGFNPAAIVTFGEPVDPAVAAQVSNYLAQAHGGANAGKRPAVFGGKDIKVERLTMSMVDAQFIEQNEKVFDVTMALWRVPPTVAGMVGKPSSWGTGVAEFSRGLERFTLRPIVLRFQAGFEACLTNPVDERLQVRFKFDGMLAASPKDRAEIQRLALMNGLTSQERILAQNDEPPFDDTETVYSALSQASDADRDMSRLKLRADVYGALIRSGVKPEAAAVAAGFDPGMLESLGLRPVTLAMPPSPPEDNPDAGA